MQALLPTITVFQSVLSSKRKGGVEYNKFSYVYILDNFNFNSDFKFNSKCSHM